MQFFIEVLIGGLLSGVMYALVALGFVLIYKASGVFNFAQGAMVFFAALTFVGFQEVLPGWLGLEAGSNTVFWLAFLLAFIAMIVLGVATERIVLRPLVNQPHITLFMATIGLTYLVEGVAQMVWGANVRGLDLGIVDEPIAWLMDNYEIGVSKFDLFAAGVAASLVALQALLFQYTKVGRALRAVAGFVALVAGMIWGARNGVQFALTFTALKALPVLILGGFTSVPGAIIGGLIIGASEKLAEVYVGPYVGGGIEGWFPYMLALAFLLVRPEGLFGEKHIDRV